MTEVKRHIASLQYTLENFLMAKDFVYRRASRKPQYLTYTYNMVHSKMYV